jgi:hypothetical protein
MLCRRLTNFGIELKWPLLFENDKIIPSSSVLRTLMVKNKAERRLTTRLEVRNRSSSLLE